MASTRLDITRPPSADPSTTQAQRSGGIVQRRQQRMRAGSGFNFQLINSKRGKVAAKRGRPRYTRACTAPFEKRRGVEPPQAVLNRLMQSEQAG
jgi:hypothetical protein